MCTNIRWSGGYKNANRSFKSCRLPKQPAGIFHANRSSDEDLSSSCRIEHLALGTIFRFDCLWCAWNTTTCPEPQHLGQLRSLEGWKGENCCRFLSIYLPILSTCNMSWGNERCKIHNFLVCANWKVYKWNTASLLMGFTVKVEVFFSPWPFFSHCLLFVPVGRI